MKEDDEERGDLKERQARMGGCNDLKGSRMHGLGEREGRRRGKQGRSRKRESLRAPQIKPLKQKKREKVEDKE